MWSKIAARLKHRVRGRRPAPPWQPVFILGCGRSGTTVFGSALAQHPQVLYLNEPREMWFRAFPETDIWTEHAAERRGRLVLTAADAEPSKSAKLRAQFAELARARGCTILIEKLPINNFRLGLIRHIFPEARYLHLYRDGLEVAQSIARCEAAGGWYGRHGYKWEQLAACAESQPATQSAAAACMSVAEQGLLEWRLSTEAAVQFLRGLPEASWWEGSYAALVERPVETLAAVLGFLGLPPAAEVERFAREKITRQTAAAAPRSLGERERQLGGALLPLSQTARGGLARPIP